MWWSEWKSIKNAESRSFHIALLNAVLDSIRGDLKAGGNEGIKVEVWARQQPNGHGRLGVWAATYGDIEPKFSHSDEVSLKSKYVAIQTFCAGSPQLVETTTISRWRSYYAVPIWNYSRTGCFISGVVVIASMPDVYDSEKVSSISFDNIEAVQRAADMAADAAEFILNYRVPEELREQFLSHLRSQSGPIPGDLLAQIDPIPMEK
ncbi:MAG: hypothetical protein ABIR57_03710, partial [Aeromicrobium sp.]